MEHLDDFSLYASFQIFCDIFSMFSTAEFPKHTLAQRKDKAVLIQHAYVYYRCPLTGDFQRDAHMTCR